MNRRIKKKLTKRCGFKTWSKFRYHKITQLAANYEKSTDDGMSFVLITTCKKIETGLNVFIV